LALAVESDAGEFAGARVGHNEEIQELCRRNAELTDNLEEQGRSDLAATVDGNGHRSRGQGAAVRLAA